MPKTGRPTNKLVENATKDDGIYVEPPFGATPGFVNLWWCIVKDFPPEHFRESDRPLLEDYVETRLKLKAVNAECERTPYTEVDPNNGKSKISAIHELSIKLSSRINQLSRSLHLAPSCRLENKQVPKESEWRKNQRSSAKEEQNAAARLKLA